MINENFVKTDFTDKSLIFIEEGGREILLPKLSKISLENNSLFLFDARKICIAFFSNTDVLYANNRNENIIELVYINNMYNKYLIRT